MWDTRRTMENCEAAMGILSTWRGTIIAQVEMHSAMREHQLAATGAQLRLSAMECPAPVITADLERRLARGNMPEGLKAAKLREIEELKRQGAVEKARNAEEKIQRRYKMVKFFEERKLIRRLNDKMRLQVLEAGLWIAELGTPRSARAEADGKPAGAAARAGYEHLESARRRERQHQQPPVLLLRAPRACSGGRNGCCARRSGD